MTSTLCKKSIPKPKLKWMILDWTLLKWILNMVPVDVIELSDHARYNFFNVNIK